LKGEAENCFAAGMDDYIAKPVQLPKLLEKLERWLPVPSKALVAAAAPVERKRDPSSEPPLDRAVLAEISGGNEDLERQMLAEFKRFNAADVSHLFDALQKRHAKETINAAHRMKGASRTLGAVSLASLCEQIEAAARLGDWDAIAACRERLGAELERLDRYIEGADFSASPSE
jgi:two-component system, NarL family, sensor histidine kinase EvgS